MLHWQPNEHKNVSWSFIIGISCLIHVLMLATLFFVYRDAYDASLFTVYQHKNVREAEVVLVPLYKRMGGNHPIHVPVASEPARATSGADSTQPPPTSSVTAQHENDAKKMAEANQKNSPIKNESSTFVVTQKKKGAQKQLEEKRKKEQIKKKKEQLKLKKERELERKRMKEAAMQSALLDKTREVKSEVQADVTKKELTMPADMGKPGPMYVGQEEFDALMVQNELQQEIERCWVCPPGTNASCTVTTLINLDGSFKDAQTKKSSGILVFDVSATEALHAMQFPRAVWGKEITITFNS